MAISDNINNRRATDNVEIDDLVSRWKQYNAPKDASALYTYLSPTINSAVTSYAGGDKSLRVPAYRLAFDALRTYDPSKGADIKTHVYNNLKRLNRLHADRSNITHVPEGVAHDRNIIAKAISNFQDEYNREPNDDELSDITKLSKKRIDKILGRTNIISGSEAVTDEGADRISKTGISEDTYIDYVYSSSDDIDKKIIEMMSGHRGRKIYSGNEAARKLNMTPAAISLRINKIRDRMAEVKGLL